MVLIQIKNEVNKEYNAKNDVKNKVSSAVDDFRDAACVFYFVQTVFIPYSQPKEEEDENSYSIRNKLFQ